MPGRLAHWLRVRVDAGVFETKGDVSTFVLYTVLTATVLATGTYLTVASILAYFDMLPYPLLSAIRFGGTTTVLIAASVTALLAWLVGTAIRDLSISRAEFRRLSRLDPLTGLINRRAFADAMELAAPSGFVALFDIDRFKSVNDRFGHATGDEVIVAVAAELERTFGAPHLVARLGGEEFAVYVDTSDPADCLLLVEEARRSATLRTESDVGAGASVTLSAGVADHDGTRPLAGVIEAADHALYLAKSLGRDRAIHERQAEDLLAPTRKAVAGGRRS